MSKFEYAFSPVVLEKNASVEFLRVFHVESFRGGMNRLMFRSLPGNGNRRQEVLFQYVQGLVLPLMKFSGLVIRDVTKVASEVEPWSNLLIQFPENRVFKVAPGLGHPEATIVAGGCAWGEDDQPAGAPTMWP